jgi:glyoxylase-like metal-dependent hydrolase (beta-lactamase superfamily II)
MMTEKSGATSLRIMCSGFLHFDRSALTYGIGMGEVVRAPSLMFLLEHPRGRVLFETGLDPMLARNGKAYWGDLCAIYQPIVSEEDTIVPQLGRVGLTPDDIDYVVMSCLYEDHAGGLKCFPNSLIVVQGCELQEAWWTSHAIRVTYGDPYVLADVRDTRGYHFLELQGEDFDIFGDGSVVVLSVPCHARGEQALLVRMVSGRTYLMPAGAIPTRPNLETDTMTGRLVVTPDVALRNVTRLKEIARREQATVLLHHDLAAWESYRHSPEAYD